VLHTSISKADADRLTRAALLTRDGATLVEVCIIWRRIFIVFGLWVPVSTRPHALCPPPLLAQEVEEKKYMAVRAQAPPANPIDPSTFWLLVFPDPADLWAPPCSCWVAFPPLLLQNRHVYKTGLEDVFGTSPFESYSLKRYGAPSLTASPWTRPLCVRLRPRCAAVPRLPASRPGAKSWAEVAWLASS
jgi:hypothetical protein